MALWRRFGGGRSAASTFSPQRTPRGKHGKANMFPQKRTYTAPPLRPSFSTSLRRDHHKETRNPEANPLTPIAAPTIRERATGDPDPRRNRNATFRKPSCLALTRQTAGVIEHKTSQQKRMMGVTPNARPSNRNSGRKRSNQLTKACTLLKQNANRRSKPHPRPAAQPRAHKRLCRSYNRPNATFRRHTIHDHIRRNIAPPRQR